MKSRSVLALIDGLAAGMDTADWPERGQGFARLRQAIQVTVQQMPDARYLPGS